MPRFAFRFTSTFGAPLVDAAGRPGGEDSGGSLLRRLMRLVDAPILVDDTVTEPTGAGWFERVPLRCLDVNHTVLVNLDCVDSPELYRVLRRGSWRNRPRVMNVVWWNLSEWTDPVERGLLALSFARFPTFCNSPRTESEVRDAIRASQPASSWQARVASEYLGVVDPAVAHDVDAPLTVVYPAMWLFARKRPKLFTDIVAPIVARAPVGVRARLAARELDKPVATAWRRLGWSVAGLADPETYRQELASATVFVASALDESYGIQYAELMLAGAVGVFPDREWVDTLLPTRFPLRYETVGEARRMLRGVLADPAAARSLMTGPVETLRARHQPELFDEAFLKQAHEWLDGDW